MRQGPPCIYCDGFVLVGQHEGIDRPVELLGGQGTESGPLDHKPRVGLKAYLGDKG